MHVCKIYGVAYLCYMIFIFGYHPITKIEGPVEELECPNCHNTKHWLLGKMTYFINVFFIPLIPTKTEYFKVCPICKFRKEVTREDYSKEKEFANLNKEAVNSNMSDEEYEQRLNSLQK